MVNKKLNNVGEGTASSDAITKHQLDTAMIDKHDNNQNIDLKNTYNVINSKKRTKTQLDRNKPSIVSYDEVRDNFFIKKRGSCNGFLYKYGWTYNSASATTSNQSSSDQQAVC